MSAAVTFPSAQSRPTITFNARKTRRSFRAVLGWVGLGIAALGVSAHAQTLTVLHNFNGGDGASPRAALVLDNAGNLYGTAGNGGIYQKCDNEVGGGTVYKVSPAGTFTLLHEFNNQGDGCFPDGVVLDSAGNLYGETLGNIFEVNTSDQFSIFYDFASFRRGSEPYGALWRDANGNIYGTTLSGGAFRCGLGTGCGTIFKIDAAGNETVLYNFTGKADGSTPSAGVIGDAAGNLYGTTMLGAQLSGTCKLPNYTIHGCGTVFKLAPDGTFTVLHTFTGGSDGQNPIESPLTPDAAGNLYGVTSGGGNMSCNYPYGCGTVFKITPSGVKTTLHTFQGGAEGAYPSGALVLDAAGNVYGVAQGGGNSASDGVLFRLDGNGRETVLHQFNGNDGSNPMSGLIRDRAGNFYGTTIYGGQVGYGNVFKFTP